MLDEARRVGRVAHQAVEDRPERLRRGEAHVLVGLVDDQLHRRQLRERDARQVARPAAATVASSSREGHRAVDQLRPRPPRRPDSGRPVSAYSLRLRQPEPVEPHAGQVAAPHAASTACRCARPRWRSRGPRRAPCRCRRPRTSRGPGRSPACGVRQMLMNFGSAPSCGRWPSRSPCRGPSGRRSS